MIRCHGGYHRIKCFVADGNTAVRLPLQTPYPLAQADTRALLLQPSQRRLGQQRAQILLGQPIIAGGFIGAHAVLHHIGQRVHTRRSQRRIERAQYQRLPEIGLQQPRSIPATQPLRHRLIRFTALAQLQGTHLARQRDFVGKRNSFGKQQGVHNMPRRGQNACLKTQAVGHIPLQGRFQKSLIEIHAHRFHQHLHGVIRAEHNVLAVVQKRKTFRRTTQTARPATGIFTRFKQG